MSHFINNGKEIQRIKVFHPVIWKSLEILKKEQRGNEIIIKQRISRAENSHYEKKYKDSTAKFNASSMNFEVTKCWIILTTSLIIYLKNISFFFQFKSVLSFFIAFFVILF
uniref:Uncharacterized protein n=1 Tax=Octopus bimaculoides TaxID=37653 RepID=A0A0L8GXG2_OCTBM